MHIGRDMNGKPRSVDGNAGHGGPPPTPLSASRICLYLALVTAGLLGNHFRVSLFWTVEYTLGSIFAILALQLFGLRAGVAAAAIISSYTILAWNHPYAIVIMTAEVLCTGLLFYRRQVGMVVADTIFWLFVGMPLVYLFYHLAMHTSISGTMVIMAKQALNGIANTLAARCIYIALSMSPPKGQLRVGETITNIVVLCVLLPVLVLIVVVSQADFSENDREIRDALNSRSEMVAETVDHWVSHRLKTAVGLVEQVQQLPQSQMQQRLDQALRSDQNFLGLELIDREGLVVAAAGKPDGTRVPLHLQFFDRDHFNRLVRTGKPYVGRGVAGKTAKHEPLLAVVAPVIINGRVEGCVVGVTDTESLRRMIELQTGHDRQHFTLLDESGICVMTSRPDQEVTHPLQRGPGQEDRLSDGVMRWVSRNSANLPVMERWYKTIYFVKKSVGASPGWSLVIDQPLARYQDMAYRRNSSRLFLMLGILLLAILLAQTLSRLVTAKLLEFAALTTALPAKLEQQETVSLPSPYFREIAQVIYNFEEMAMAVRQYLSRLRVVNNELETLNTHLEQKVSQRTCELQKSRDEWVRTFDAIPDMVLVLDAACRIIHANKAAQARLGCDALEGRLCHELMHGSERLPHCCPLAEGPPGGTDREAEFFEPHLRIYLHVSITPLYEQGVLSGYIHVARDITERKRTEESLRVSDRRWQFALEGSGDGIWDWNMLTNEVFFSPQWKALLGYREDELSPRIDEWVGRVHPDDLPGCWRDLQRYQDGETLIYSNEHRLRCKDGTYKWILDRGQAVQWDDAGRPVRMIGSHFDMSARKETEEALKEAKEAERSANAAKSRLLATVAHEFHTPLGVLTLGADILERYGDRLTPEERSSQCGQIRSAARQLSYLVDTVSALKDGDAPAPASGTVQAATLIRSISEEVQAVWSKGQAFTVEIEDGVDEVTVEEVPLRRVAMNLLTNAFRFTPTEGCITFSARRGAAGLVIEVRDTGIGIPEAELQHVFKPFFRGHNVGSRQGLGLGLSIVSETVGELGGKIEVTSNPVRGSVFVAEIPITVMQEN